MGKTALRETMQEKTEPFDSVLYVGVTYFPG